MAKVQTTTQSTILYFREKMEKVIHQFKNAINKDELFKIGTFNLNGNMTYKEKRDLLVKDMESKKIKICCFQETYHDGDTFDYEKGKLIFVERDENLEPHKRYGLGFYISNELSENYWGYKYISNRIAVANFKLSNHEGKMTTLKVINIYAPTTRFTELFEEETMAFTQQLDEVIIQSKIGTDFLIIAGDFNAKFGQKEEGENFIGPFGKGTRNGNGVTLANILNKNNFYITNTHFQHRYTHRTTWISNFSNHKYKNQIDYICVNNILKKLLTNAQSYNNTRFISDHKLLICEINLKGIYKRRRIKNKFHNPRFNFESLKEDVILNQIYQNRLRDELTTISNTNVKDVNIDDTYNSMMMKISKVSNELIPKEENSININEFCVKNPHLNIIRNSNNNLRNQLHNNTLNTERKRMIRGQMRRNSTVIRRIIKNIKRKKYDEIVKEINNAKSSQKLFMYQKMLSKGSKYQKFKLYDSDNNLQENHIPLLKISEEFYQNFYNNPEIQEVNGAFVGEARSLTNPITMQEIKEAIKIQNNRRACGMDGIYIEQMKEASEIVSPTLMKLYNGIFEKHETINAINEGILIPLNKPSKPKKISNSRPITLLNISRKILSSIVLKRIKPILDNYVRVEQCGFRSGRCAGEIIWQYRWLEACCERNDRSYRIMGIDMSKAFDSINRSKLLNVLEEILYESEYRIIRYLITNTTLKARINGNYGNTFYTRIGVPQGDALSPALFIIYLEAIMRKFNLTIPRPMGDLNNIYLESAYADDVDYIDQNPFNIDMIYNLLPETLKEFNLNINVQKTEFTNIERDNRQIKTKKLGSLLGEMKEVEYRIKNANSSFMQLYNIWTSNIINTEVKMKIYNAIVLSKLTYNCGSIGLSAIQLGKMDTINRKHLKIINKIFWPNIISKENLYAITHTKPIHQIVQLRRWNMLYRSLNQPIHFPAHKIMQLYCYIPKTQPERKFNIATIFNKELKLINRQLVFIDDLQWLKTKSENIEQWNQMVGQIIIGSIHKENERKTREIQRRELKRLHEQLEQQNQNQIQVQQNVNINNNVNNNNNNRGNEQDNDDNTEEIRRKAKRIRQTENDRKRKSINEEATEEIQKRKKNKL